jgi:23S rRNA (adenine2503-C2)-methyltransferase
MINLHTIPVEELETILKAWGQPKYRAQQISNWVRLQGVTSIDEMNNIPKKLKEQLKEHAILGALQLDTELISKDGTIKRAYRLADGQLIESVLMPYEDGRYTACISSQAGCAQGCVFCATGQMGFSRQLTPDEILEQVSRFASELAAQDKQQRKEGDDDEEEESNKKKGGAAKGSVKGHGRSTRLSNIVFMGSKLYQAKCYCDIFLLRRPHHMNAYLYLVSVVYFLYFILSGRTPGQLPQCQDSHPAHSR